MRGWYAVLIDDVSPIRSGIGSYRTREQAMQPCTNHCCLADAAALQWGMPRPQKITFGEMRSSGDARSPDLLLRLSLQPFDRDQRRSMAGSGPALGSGTALRVQGPAKGADVRPNFHWARAPALAMGTKADGYFSDSREQYRGCAVCTEVRRESAHRRRRAGCAARRSWFSLRAGRAALGSPCRTRRPSRPSRRCGRQEDDTMT